MIGIFDSGSGGLTILDALRRTLPRQDFLYFGDHGNAPYGHRSNEQIVGLTQRGVNLLMARGCKLVILACNTAAAVALRRLQQNWLPDAYPDNRILGVLVPMVEVITGLPWSHTGTYADAPEAANQSIVIFATQKTVESGAYSEEVHKRAPAVHLQAKACPGLVDAIEGGAGPKPLKGLIHGYIEEMDLTSVQAAVLGCTHFPLVEPLFRQALPAHIKIYSQPQIVADATRDYLTRRPHFASENAKGTGTVQLLTSGNPKTVEAISQQFFSDLTHFEKI